VPLQHGLARGVGLLVDPPAVLGSLVFAFTWMVWMVPDRKKTVQERANRIADLRQLSAQIERAAAGLQQAAPDVDLSGVRRRLARADKLIA
jgi:hypothetical protein